MTPIIYVAGPYRAATAWGVEQNVRRAEEWALRVAFAGAMPLCPHTNTRFFHGVGPDEFWLAGTMELLRRSDAILLIPEWSRSSGACAERAEAERRGIPIFEAVASEGAPYASWADLPGWIERRRAP